MVAVKFPQRGLPGLADYWGRAVETGVQGFLKSTDEFAAKLDTANRGASGKIAVMSTQTTELANRIVRQAHLQTLERSSTIQLGEVFLPGITHRFEVDVPTDYNRNFLAVVTYDFQSRGGSQQFVSTSNYATVSTNKYTFYDQGRAGKYTYWTSTPPGWDGESGTIVIPGVSDNGVARVEVTSAALLSMASGAPAGETKYVGLENITVSITVEDRTYA